MLLRSSDFFPTDLWFPAAAASVVHLLILLFPELLLKQRKPTWKEHVGIQTPTSLDTSFWEVDLKGFCQIFPGQTMHFS